MSVYEDDDEDKDAIVVGFLDYFDGDDKTLVTMKIIMIKSNRLKRLIITSLSVVLGTCFKHIPAK